MIKNRYKSWEESQDADFSSRNRVLLFVVAYLGLFKIPYFAQISSIISLFYNAALFAVFTVSVVLWIKSQQKITSFLLLSLFMMAVLLISCITNNKPIQYQFILRVLAFIILLLSLPGEYRKDCYRALSIVFCLYSCINSISVIVFPGALYANVDNRMVCWFFGEDNVTVNFMIFAVIVTFIEAYYVDKRTYNARFVVAFISYMFFVWYQDIGTGKLCSIVLIILILLSASNKLKMKLRHAYIIVAVLFGLVVVSNSVAYFKFLIEDILGRNLTLSTRTNIWQVGIEAIMDKPIIGHGTFTSIEVGFFMRGSYLYPSTPHDTFLTVTYCGGFLMLALFISILIVSSIKFDTIAPSSGKYLLISMFFVLLVHALGEGNDLEYILYTASLYYSLSDIAKQREDCSIVIDSNADRIK